ncbi:hypothetical protein [Labilibacter marinus]|uniref:hypothetical protein n=1 Tax=Labilibacter marinus TaxID=1477105 RepID=UPI00082D557B|nr:hypothetical protein [Labilibacter marinus]
MNVYSIKVDVNNYQWISPVIKDGSILDYTVFNCQKKEKNLSEIEWYSINPNSKEGNFYSLGSNGAFAFDDKVYNSDLLSIFEMAGEVIPIKVKNKKLYVLNVLECMNCLNEELSEWEIYSDGSRGRILSYSFLRSRICESSIFKIPQTQKGEVLTYTGIKEKSDEFMSLYQSLNFEGLVFDKLTL